MALISSQDWKSAQSGQVVVLTDEERRTLIAEGYPIPQRFPLSKAEERSLKKIRRKIKNKISAQESRRKKKEYMEELEKKVQTMEAQIAMLERQNSDLMRQIGKAGDTKGATAAAAKTTNKDCVRSDQRDSKSLNACIESSNDDVRIEDDRSKVIKAESDEQYLNLRLVTQRQQQQYSTHAAIAESGELSAAHSICNQMIKEEREAAVESGGELTTH